MIEIIEIILMSNYVSKLARSKGRSAGWAGMCVALWFIGECIGAIVGIVLGLPRLQIYLFAFGFGVVALLVGIFIVWRLPPAPDFVPNTANPFFREEYPTRTAAQRLRSRRRRRMR